MATIEVDAAAFAKLPDALLEQVLELAKAEAYLRREHHAEDGCVRDEPCVKHEPDEAVETEAGQEAFGDLSVGDIYEDDGRWYRIEDITAVGSGDDLTYHVDRVMVDD